MSHIKNFLKMIKEKGQKIVHFFIAKKQFLKYAAIALAAILLLWAVFYFYQKSAQKKYSAIFHQALIYEEKGNLDAATENLEKIHTAKFAPSGVKGLSNLHYAGLLFNLGQADKAFEIYQDLAFGIRYNRYIRDLSSLLAAKILVIKTDVDTDKTLQQQHLKQIEKFVSNSKIMRDYLLEQQGILQIKIGNREDARKIFTEILQDPNLESSLRARIADLVNI